MNETPDELRAMARAPQHYSTYTLSAALHTALDHLAEAEAESMRLRQACGPIITMLDVMDHQAQVYGVTLPTDDSVATHQRVGGGMSLMLTWGELRALRAAAALSPEEHEHNGHS